MSKTRFSAEQIVTLLRQIELSMARGNATPVACREARISPQNYATYANQAPTKESHLIHSIQ
jgi:hypothetical protein